MAILRLNEKKLTFKEETVSTDIGVIRISKDGQLEILSNSDSAGKTSSLKYTVSDEDGNTDTQDITITIFQNGQVQTIVGNNTQQNPGGVSTTPVTKYRIIAQDLSLEVKRGESVRRELKDNVLVIGVPKSQINLIFEETTAFIQNAGKGTVKRGLDGILQYSSAYNGTAKQHIFKYTVSSGNNDYTIGTITVNIIDEYNNDPPSDDETSQGTSGGTGASGGSTGAASSGDGTIEGGGAFNVLPQDPPVSPNTVFDRWDLSGLNSPEAEIVDNLSTIDETLPPTPDLIGNPDWNVDRGWDIQQGLMQDSVPNIFFPDSTRPFEETLIEGTDISIEQNDTPPIDQNDTPPLDTTLIPCGDGILEKDLSATPIYINYSFNKNFKARYICMHPSNRVYFGNTLYLIQDNLQYNINLNKLMKDFPDYFIVTFCAGIMGIIIPPSFDHPFGLERDSLRSCSYRSAVYLRGFGYSKFIGEDKIGSKYDNKCIYNNEPPIPISSNYIRVIDFEYEKFAKNIDDKRKKEQLEPAFTTIDAKQKNYMKDVLQWDKLNQMFRGDDKRSSVYNPLIYTNNILES